VFVGGVVDDQIDQHLDAALFGPVHKGHEVAARAVARVDAVKVGDVVAVVAVRRGLKGREPERVHPQPVEVVEPPHQPFKVADAVAVSVHKGLKVEAVDDGVFVPQVFDHHASFIKWSAK
jgi:hypothetical protein